MPWRPQPRKKGMKSMEEARVSAKDTRALSSTEVKKQIAFLMDKIADRLKSETNQKKAAQILSSWIPKK